MIVWEMFLQDWIVLEMVFTKLTKFFIQCGYLYIVYAC